jgi:UPF0755 protein
MRLLGRFLLFGLLIAVLASGAAAWVVRQRLQAPFKGYASEEQFVDLPRGTRPQAIGRALVSAGVIRDPVVFRVALWLSGSARRLKAGEYRFDQPMTPGAVIAKIASGDVFLRSITFPEGLAIRDLARGYEARGFGAAASFAEAAAAVDLVADLDPAARDLEGYLFPDTYALGRRDAARELVAMMVARFRTVAGPELLREARARGLSVRGLVTLASIVEKEASDSRERPVIAAVYLKRLRIGMPLQSDPTVIYALERAGRYRGNLTRENLTFDSPYNTYRHAGLPPGPIAAPGRSALEAAAKAPDTEFLYFVSRNDGTHEFARTLAEHNRNVQRFQVEYFKGGKVRESPQPQARSR